MTNRRESMNIMKNMHFLFRTTIVCDMLLGVTLAGAEVSSDTADFDDVVRASYLATHDGWSSDEVLLHPERNQAFLIACRERLSRRPLDAPVVTDEQLNWAMLRLRKSNRLGGDVTRRSPLQHGAYQDAVEIAARMVEDIYQVNMDRVFCDPSKAAEFDRIARRLVPNVARYRLRKAAFGLRKADRLKPELLLRVADWERKVTTSELVDLRRDAAAFDGIPAGPGVYLFLDATGYLYIGESENLRARVAKHIHDSDSESLAKYLNRPQANEAVLIELHAFDPASRAKETGMRRAYESALITSRRPRFNERP